MPFFSLSLMFQRFSTVLETECSLKCGRVTCEYTVLGDNSLRTSHGQNPDCVDTV